MNEWKNSNYEKSSMATCVGAHTANNEHGLGEVTERGACQYFRELRSPTKYICAKLVSTNSV